MKPLNSPGHRNHRLAKPGGIALYRWTQTTGRLLATHRCPPALLALTAQVWAALPSRGKHRAYLTGFVLRHMDTLAEMVDAAYRDAPPPGHPHDTSPPRVGPLHRSMTLAQAEDAIRHETEEHLVIVDDDTGLQVGRFGPEATWASGHDPHGLCWLDSRLYLPATMAGTWVVSHNHPGCGPLSAGDISVACAMNLQSIRAVCADGRAWWIDRPTGKPHSRWPHHNTGLRIAEEAAMDAYDDADRRYCATPGPPSEQSHAWKEHFNKSYFNRFNAAGRAYGLRMHTAKVAPGAP